MGHIGKRRRTIRRRMPVPDPEPIMVPDWPKPEREEVGAPIEVPAWPKPAEVPADPTKTT
jgi:hypothetical protein